MGLYLQAEPHSTIPSYQIVAFQPRYASAMIHSDWKLDF